MLNAAELLAQM